MVHIFAETLTGVTNQGDRLEPDTCRRLLCDSGLVFIGSWLPLPWLTNHRFVDAHHIRQWVHGTRALGDPSISAESNQPGWDGWPVDTTGCAEALI